MRGTAPHFVGGEVDESEALHQENICPKIFRFGENNDIHEERNQVISGNTLLRVCRRVESKKTDQ